LKFNTFETFLKMIFKTFIMASLFLFLIQKFYILILIFTLSALLYHFVINSPHNKRTLLHIRYPNILYVDQFGKIYEN
jgi:hypothetical protein